MRLITVVMGEPSSSIRNMETVSMLDYGFHTYEIDTILSKKTVLETKKVLLGQKKEVQIVPKVDANVLNSKTGTKRNVTYQFHTNTIKAPVKMGDVVGKIDIIENKNVIMTIDATVKESVEKANIITSYIRDLLDVMKGNI